MPAIPAAQKKNLKTSEAYSIYYTNSGQKKEWKWTPGGNPRSLINNFFQGTQKKEKNPKWEYVPGGNPSSLTNAKKLTQMKDKNKDKN